MCVYIYDYKYIVGFIYIYRFLDLRVIKFVEFVIMVYLKKIVIRCVVWYFKVKGNIDMIS